MPRILLLLALGFAAYLSWQWFTRLSPSQKRQHGVAISLWALAILALFLAATGKLHWLGAALTAVLAVGRSLLPVVLKLIPWLASNKPQAAPARGSSTMTIDEAYAVLGLKPPATQQDIIEAHRRLMAKLHPDKGGNDFLAAQLNTAKDTLMDLTP